MHAYQDMVFSTAARLTGNDAQAEDLAQEAFLKAYEHFETLKDSPTPGGWLKTVTTNLALNYITRHRRRWKFFADFRRDDAEDDDAGSDVPDFLIGASTPDQLLAGLVGDERHAIVERALQKLPDHQRVPIVLYHFEDMPYQEIAERMKASLPKIKTDILRGRTALARILAGEGLTQEALES